MAILINNDKDWVVMCVTDKDLVTCVVKFNTAAAIQTVADFERAISRATLWEDIPEAAETTVENPAP